MTESARLRRARALPGVTEVGSVALMLGLAAVAWALIYDWMGGMDAGPGTELGGVAWFSVAWLTMMAAMMLPSVAPRALDCARLLPRSRALPRRAQAVAITAFVAGYLFAWLAAGLVGYAVVEEVRSLEVGFLAGEAAGRYVAGGVIVAAAGYQLTAVKRACVRRCRSSLSLLRQEHRGGVAALRMGIEHGALCIGCCWAMMAALFALGPMSIGWMVVIAAMIAAEKLLPWRRIATRGAAVLLAALGITVSFAPEDVLVVFGLQTKPHDSIGSRKAFSGSREATEIPTPMIGLAARPGSAVEPIWSMRTATLPRAVRRLSSSEANSRGLEQVGAGALARGVTELRYERSSRSSADSTPPSSRSDSGTTQPAEEATCQVAELGKPNRL